MLGIAVQDCEIESDRMENNLLFREKVIAKSLEGSGGGI